MAREDIRKEGNNEENKNQSPKKHRNPFWKETNRIITYMCFSIREYILPKTYHIVVSKKLKVGICCKCGM